MKEKKRRSSTARDESSLPPRKRTVCIRDEAVKKEAVRRVIVDRESKASVSRDLNIPESTLRGWCKEEKLRDGVVMDNSDSDSPRSPIPQSSSSTHHETTTANGVHARDEDAPEPAKRPRMDDQSGYANQSISGIKFDVLSIINSLVASGIGFKESADLLQNLGFRPNTIATILAELTSGSLTTSTTQFENGSLQSNGISSDEPLQRSTTHLPVRAVAGYFDMNGNSIVAKRRQSIAAANAPSTSKMDFNETPKSHFQSKYSCSTVMGFVGAHPLNQWTWPVQQQQLISQSMAVANLSLPSIPDTDKLLRTYQQKQNSLAVRDPQPPSTPLSMIKSPEKIRANLDALLCSNNNDNESERLDSECSGSGDNDASGSGQGNANATLVIIENDASCKGEEMTLEEINQFKSSSLNELKNLKKRRLSGVQQNKK